MPSTRNVTRVFRTATPAQIAAGLDWYADAHRVAGALATRYGVTLEVSAGVIAALSPLNSWGANVNLATRFLDAGGLTSGYLGDGLRKAARILAGEHVEDVLTSPKVAAFYAGIVTNGATDIVCVDRHAMDIADNERRTDGTRPKITGKRYAAYAETYQRAARIISREIGETISAAQIQAITWKTWRNRYWAEGAFDRHEVA